MKIDSKNQSRLMYNIFLSLPFSHIHEDAVDTLSTQETFSQVFWSEVRQAACTHSD